MASIKWYQHDSSGTSMKVWEHEKIKKNYSKKKDAIK